MCYYDLAISSSRLSNLSCKLLDHYLNAPRDWTLLCLSCGAVVALSRLFSCSWVPGPGPGYLGTWVPGYQEGKKSRIRIMRQCGLFFATMWITTMWIMRQCGLLIHIVVIHIFRVHIVVSPKKKTTQSKCHFSLFFSPPSQPQNLHRTPLLKMGETWL